jgi:hypothetical protein
MDFLEFNPEYSILICTRCGYAVPPAAIRAHLKGLHRKELSDVDIKAYAEACLAYNVAPPAKTQRRAVPLDTPPIPHLKIYAKGIRCQLCKTDTPYICHADRNMRIHLKDVHSLQSTT